MPRFLSLLRPALTGRSLLLAALAVEVADELADGIRGAALPLIRHSLALTYPQIGLLFSVPLLLGGLLELPVGILSGHGARRRRAVLGGGLVFIASLAAVAVAGSFGWLLAAFVVFFPASGAFVSLTQAELMDASPARRAQHMARWTLAGSAGAVAGPLLLTGVLAAGGSWRAAYLVLAAVAGAAWLAMAGTGRWGPAPGHTSGPAGADSGKPATADGGSAVTADSGSAVTADSGSAVTADGGALAGADSGEPASPDGGRAAGAGRDASAGAGRGQPAKPARSEPAGHGRWWSRPLMRARAAAGVVRRAGALRWLVLLQVADLLGDVLTGFLALYLVDVAGATPAQAALGVAVRLGAGLAGDVVLVHLLERTGDLRVLRVGAAAAALLYPAFLLVPWLGGKLAVLALLSLATASWYPVMQARWYQSLAGHSDIAVSLESAATMAGGLGPAAVGAFAAWSGLAPALAALAVVPLVVLAALSRRARRPGTPPAGPASPPAAPQELNLLRVSAPQIGTKAS